MTTFVSKDKFDASKADASAWVSANAGSGKTFVLVTRLVSLLLSGTRPEKLLCLTYTKSAAAEMQERLFQLLGDWAVMPQEKLKKEMQARLGKTPTRKEISQARVLFARALETPGGIKVQTIHAFCESLLNRFSLEAGITPNFKVLDDRLFQTLVQQTRNDILRHADGALRTSLDRLTRKMNEERFDAMIGEIIRSRNWFYKNDKKQKTDLLLKILELDERQDADTLMDRFLSHFGAREARQLAAIYADNVAPALDKAEVFLKLEALFTNRNKDTAESKAEIWQLLEGFFLTQKGEPRKILMTQKCAQAFPEWKKRVDDWAEIFIDTCEQLKKLYIFEQTQAVYDFAEGLLVEIEQRKIAQNLLDYDDLIEKTVSLLSNRDASAWVLYKLDGGLDHILVDEAQDTSPTQWRVIQALAEEFFSGDTAREVVRTVFAVGDEKQSIFSFQGAEPRKFDDMRRHFESATRAVNQPFFPVDLENSYRSVADILQLVDKVSNAREMKNSLTAQKKNVVHKVVREQNGLVELWDYEKGVRQEKVDYWAAPTPVETQVETQVEMQETPRARLARRIAYKIKTLIDDPQQVIRPKDILILVQNRDAFVVDMIRALKRPKVNVPVVGADRMQLTKQIAVMDLLAAARAALLPQDDLMLATFLRSPLGDISEAQLFDLCYGAVPQEDTGPQPLLRKMFLCDRLRQMARTDKAHFKLQKAHARFEELCKMAHYVPPFEFFATLLGSGHGRSDLIARLGQEVDDPVDELLSLALDFERQLPPSLEAFVHWVENSETEVKRDMEQAMDAVRIMTVHGAKGLEAPIVFMPDTCRPADNVGASGTPLMSAQGALLYRPNQNKLCAAATEYLKENKMRAFAEHNRLLYVALTRARDRLYICGHIGANRKQPPADSWYNLVADVIKKDPLTKKGGTQEEPIWQYGTPDVFTKKAAPPRVKAQSLDDIPQWLDKPAMKESQFIDIESPSMLLKAVGTKKLRPPIAGDALQRGTLIHNLLEGLAGVPDALKADEQALQHRARLYLQRHGVAFDEPAREKMTAEVLKILSAAEHAPLFGSESRAELPVTGRLKTANGWRHFAGRIDRYVETEDEIIIADYKTNRKPAQKAEDIADAYIGQMAVYQALVRRQTDKPVTCWLLWTSSAYMQHVPDGLMERILAKIL